MPVRKALLFIIGISEEGRFRPPLFFKKNRAAWGWGKGGEACQASKILGKKELRFSPRVYEERQAFPSLSANPPRLFMAAGVGEIRIVISVYSSLCRIFVFECSRQGPKSTPHPSRSIYKYDIQKLFIFFRLWRQLAHGDPLFFSGDSQGITNRARGFGFKVKKIGAKGVGQKGQKGPKPYSLFLCVGKVFFFSEESLQNALDQTENFSVPFTQRDSFLSYGKTRFCFKSFWFGLLIFPPPPQVGEGGREDPRTG